MGEKFRLLVDQELAEHRPPPVGHLIQTAMAEGRRIKRRRTVRNSLAGAALAGVLLVATAFAVPVLRGAGPPAADRSGAGAQVAASADPSVLATPGVAAASPVASRPVPRASPSGMPASDGTGGATVAGTADLTPSAALLLLTTLLPNGRTSNYAGHLSSNGMITVQTYLDRGQGPGMLHLTLAPGSMSDAATCTVGEQDGINTTRCRTFPDGATLETYEITNNCVQRYGALYVSKDGFAVHLNTASCLDWDGTRRPAGQRALTEDEAVAIVTDPAWAEKVPRSLVTDGAAQFPSLPRVLG
ncbi:hypothetical protein Val02_76060 [Virgisporangium aliadipatigenens]|uniref:Uncharacterized protein n=1 Tax=Virgisporangium aliadipatigenens TaxID=741659 RepID=A0A8J3YVT0_9ACTN|nr:hypothetical protein [Virgisporangium aliadipatigenens]GIJ50720.1 hypothetical protein Val02_76060 [Virgisporangium aliadipatigenens]